MKILEKSAWCGFEVGDRVRVKGYGAVATITELYASIPGGVRLDTPFDGFVSWNVTDLVKVEIDGETP